MAALKKIQSFYKNQAQNRCLRIYQGEIKQIILIRHGEPDIIKTGWFSHKKVLEYSKQYDKVGVLASDKKPVCAENLNVKRIYHSSMPRAAHTAHLIFDGSLEFRSDKRFREFEKTIFRILNFPMPLRFWNAISRILWFLGINTKGVESVKEAKKRVKRNASFLSQKASDEKTVILVAHGWHNRYVVKNLKKQGWYLAFNSGDGYLSVKILVNDN